MKDILSNYSLIFNIHKNNPIVIYFCLVAISLWFLPTLKNFKNRTSIKRFFSSLKGLLVASILLQITMGISLYYSKYWALSFSNSSLKYWMAIHPLFMGFGGIMILAATILRPRFYLNRFLATAGILSIITGFIFMPD